MEGKKVYNIKAKVIISQNEKSTTTQEIVFDEILVPNLKINQANSSVNEICNSVYKGTKKYYKTARIKLRTFAKNTKEKVNATKETSEDYQKFVSAKTPSEKTKVVIFHIKRDSASVGKTIKEKYQILFDSAVKMRNKIKEQNKIHIIDEDFVDTKDVSLTKKL